MRHQLQDYHEPYDYEKERFKNDRDKFKTRMDRAEARVSYLEAVREAAETVVHDWDWWQVDPIDREGPGDSICDLRDSLVAAERNYDTYE